MSHHPANYKLLRVETLSSFILQQTVTLVGPHSHCHNTNHHSSLKHMLVPKISQLETSSITIGLHRGVKKNSEKGCKQGLQALSKHTLLYTQLKRLASLVSKNSLAERTAFVN